MRLFGYCFKLSLSKFGPLSVILPATLVLAQAQAQVTCNQVLPALDKNAAACAGVDNNHVCYGNGPVSAKFQASASNAQAGFAIVGDTVGLDTIQSLTTGTLDLTQNQWGMAVIKAGIADSNSTSQGEAGPAVTLIQYGAASLTLTGSSAAASAVPTGTSTLCQTALKADSLLRTAPNGGEVVRTLANGTKVTLDGRLADSSWIFIDSNGKSGWLQSSTLSAPSSACAIGQLPIIDPTVAAIMPVLSDFSFSIGDAPDILCRDLPTGGLLIQSTTGRKVRFTVDGAQLTLDSAIAVLFASPDQSLDIAVIDGQATVTAHNNSTVIPTGQELSIPLGGNHGLVAIGTPGKLVSIQAFSGASGINLKTLCELATDVGLQVPCTLSSNPAPTAIPVPVNPTKPIIP